MRQRTLVVAACLTLSLWNVSCRREGGGASSPPLEATQKVEKVVEKRKEPPSPLELDIDTLANGRAKMLERIRRLDFKSSSSFDRVNVPLGLTLKEFKERGGSCSVSRRRGEAPVLDLVALVDPPPKWLFPEWRRGKSISFLGIGVYFGWLPAMHESGADKYRMRCADNDYEVFTLKPGGEIFAVVSYLTFGGEVSTNQAFFDTRTALARRCPIALYDELGGKRSSNSHGTEGPEVELAFCDDGDLRTVVGTTAYYERSEVSRLGILHLSLSGWRQYLATVRNTFEKKDEATRQAISSGL